MEEYKRSSYDLEEKIQDLKKMVQEQTHKASPGLKSSELALERVQAAHTVAINMDKVKPVEYILVFEASRENPDKAATMARLLAEKARLEEAVDSSIAVYNAAKAAYETAASAYRQTITIHRSTD
jgi:hypothetical protein